MSAKRKVSGLVRAGLALGAVAMVAWAERRRELRDRTERTPRRIARNLAVAGLSALAVQLAERPAVRPLARWVERRRVGLLYAARLPEWLRTALAVVLLDYTLYLWHVVEHRVSTLYRFHVVHHADLDLDASTALRFHFGEMVASVPWRAAQIALIGVSPRALGIWQRLTMISVAFHHSNIRLPLALERVLSRLVMTPRLHGIHHSIVAEEQNANWSSGLTVWDRLHGTYRANVPQDEIVIGVPAYRSPEDVTLPKIIAMPFTEGVPEWTLPDGTHPVHRARAPHAAAPGELAG